MADQLKQIRDFQTKSDFGDGDLLLIQGAGTTYNVKGSSLKKYAENAAAPQAEAAAAQAQAAAASADNAAASAERAEKVSQHPPIADPESGYWQTWDREKETYVPTTVRAVGMDFAILGYYNTLDDLRAAVPDPKPGDVYGIGLEPPYHIYIWDSVNELWKDNGAMVNTGDMTKAVYDPAGRERDIFAYTDSAIQTAILDSWGGSY